MEGARRLAGGGAGGPPAEQRERPGCEQAHRGPSMLPTGRGGGAPACRARAPAAGPPHANFVVGVMSQAQMVLHRGSQASGGGRGGGAPRRVLILGCGAGGFSRLGAIRRRVARWGGRVSVARRCAGQQPAGGAGPNRRFCVISSASVCVRVLLSCMGSVCLTDMGAAGRRGRNTKGGARAGRGGVAQPNGAAPGRDWGRGGANGGYSNSRGGAPAAGKARAKGPRGGGESMRGDGWVSRRASARGERGRCAARRGAFLVGGGQCSGCSRPCGGVLPFGGGLSVLFWGGGVSAGRWEGATAAQSFAAAGPAPTRGAGARGPLRARAARACCCCCVIERRAAFFGKRGGQGRRERARAQLCRGMRPWG
ncbi:hypothetical protein Rsub_04977 [Raphidocelis subcapitata]|uniref:Uncharacterized protein n=1 Tax=Raphidocelis subcapitata TaxID=307507 RepID=A0A2V0NYW7_9CHLO|nr:hypothetical protein Rsub_04977 [Raphidocelis subcapitata]|eukprot:GBF91872.1 hypothetical protein Rsub_04977 [Raphidocelis subcapitata]